MKLQLIVALAVFAMLSSNAFAQDTFDAFRAKLQKDFADFQNSEKRKYEEFRKKVNDDYSEIMTKAWEELQAMKGVPCPKEDKPVPPKVFPDKDRDKIIKDTPKPIDVVVPIVKPEVQPNPIVPIEEEVSPKETVFDFTFMGTKLKVRLEPSCKFSLRGCSESILSKQWKNMSDGKFNGTLSDCLDIRAKRHLCDWAYLSLLSTMAKCFFGSQCNEATLLTAYLYCQSGYKMRLAHNGGELYMLYASKHIVYDCNYWILDGENYYVFNAKCSQLNICQASFPNEKPLSLQMNTAQSFDMHKTESRTLKSKRYPEVVASVSTNKNLIQFYNTYPTSMVNEDFGTRWAIYANTPIEPTAQQSLYPALEKAISGLSQKEAVERLLNFVQTAFVYEYDDKVWGQDRAFFAEETLYYPYCDCEDRSILFSHLVRDLVGLEVVLVYYPGHLATAVNFTEQVRGDNVVVNGKRYVVCDPTYIGAPVGLTMPEMDNSKAKVILL